MREILRQTGGFRLALGACVTFGVKSGNHELPNPASGNGTGVGTKLKFLFRFEHTLEAQSTAHLSPVAPKRLVPPNAALRFCRRSRTSPDRPSSPFRLPPGGAAVAEEAGGGLRSDLRRSTGMRGDETCFAMRAYTLLPLAGMERAQFRHTSGIVLAPT